MKKLTKKQHRKIIEKLISKNEDVADLRNIQQVAEFFEEDAESRKERSVLVAADAVRLLLDLINTDCGSDAYNALYELVEDRKKDTVDNIIDILEELDERRLHLVYVYALAIAGK
ncbi:MAG: hypothetical protein Q4C91_08235 [Eubacteriales bacterium]|nr:hypothetical protein [Eubacteriales bacterium]